MDVDGGEVADQPCIEQSFDQFARLPLCPPPPYGVHMRVPGIKEI